MAKIEIKRETSLVELKYILSQQFASYKFELKEKYLMVSIPGQCYFGISIKDKVIKIERGTDFGDFILFFIPILGWIAISFRGDQYLKKIEIFLKEYFDENSLIEKSNNKTNKEVLSVCPSCKSPNEKSLIRCEWCGFEIPLKEISPDSKSNLEKNYRIVLLSSEERNRLSLIKEIKEITGLGLAESKRLAETQGSIILSSTNISLINYIKNRLEELDAFVRIEEV
jgi:hypothetical protein